MSVDSISIIGLGYIGLPTAVMFSSKKINVIGVDIDERVVDSINLGKPHISEPGLQDMLKTSVDQGYLLARTSPAPSDVFIIAVPTPFKEKKGNIPEPELKYVKEAALSIAPVLKKGNLIILESTSPVGTTELIRDLIQKERSDLKINCEKNDDVDIHIAYCPERVLPGQILKELIHNDRVIGGITDFCSEKALEVYKIFVQGNCIITNARTAEMVKLTENSSRDVQIAFANELSILCDNLGINVWELISLSNLHPRVNILQPGPGVGGHCIAVDPWFIASKDPENSKLIQTARKVNDSKPKWVLKKIHDAVAEYLKENPTKRYQDVIIGCLGVSFKADIDDLRESPAMEITKCIMAEHPGTVLVVEPNVKTIESEDFILSSINEVQAKANIVVLLVDHHEFKDIKFKNKVLIDTKGVWS